MEIPLPFTRVRSAPPAAPARRLARAPRAYSLLELLIVIFIMEIISSLVVLSISTVSDGSHLDLLAKRTIGLMRYARMLAMSAGQPCNVDFNVTSQTINLYLGASPTPVSNSLFPGGTCSINLHTGQGIAGATITAVTNSAVAPVPGSIVYRCTYGVLGTRTNAPSYAQPMTVTFTYGRQSATLSIPNAGDPN